MNNQTNGLGIASMVIGIVSVFLFPLMLGIIAFLLGFIGMAHEKRGTAIAGVVLGTIGIVFGVIKMMNGIPTL